MSRTNNSGVLYGYCQCGCGQKTELAKATNSARGWVKGEPKKRLYRHNGAPRQPKRYLVEDRGFPTRCWVWQGGTSGGGHGRTRDHSKGKMVMAHRWFYEQAKGSIPEGLQLDHLCRVRLCVNPDHLEPVTGQENRRRGEGTKLTLEAACEIKRICEESREPSGRVAVGVYDQLAARYGVGRDTVRRIMQGIHWKDATP